MALQPIFPPIERNFSPSELAEATVILDDETREMLTMDRARLLQSSAANVIALSKLIDLPPEAASELNQALLRSAKNLSPSYHAYFNSLLSAMVELQNGDEATDAATTEELEELLGDQPPQLDDLPEYAGPAVKLPFGERLFPHDQKTVRPMRRFLADVVGEAYDVQKLTPDEASLLTWQVLDFYRRYRLRGLNDKRKATHIDRISKHVGLYSAPVTLGEMGEATDEAGSASIGSTIRTAKDRINEIIGPNVRNMIARGRKTLRDEVKESLFMQEQTGLVAPEEVFEEADEELLDASDQNHNPERDLDRAVMESRSVSSGSSII